jgi:inosine/xanthosine triphosphate pyrophosphatase family protein
VPQYEYEKRFRLEFKSLSRESQSAFLEAVRRFVAALKEGRAPDNGLGIKEMKGHPGIYEFRYSRRGRATFEYLGEKRGNEAKVNWRRLGGHEIYREP